MMWCQAARNPTTRHSPMTTSSRPSRAERQPQLPAERDRPTRIRATMVGAATVGRDEEEQVDQLQWGHVTWSGSTIG